MVLCREIILLQKVIISVPLKVTVMLLFCRTEDPPAARELLTVLDIDKYFAYKEIYPGSKVTHFRK